MVCTRKKDYGEPPAKKRKPPLFGQDLTVRSDAASAVGFGDDTRDIACLSQSDCPPRIPPRVFEQIDPRFERIDQSTEGSGISKECPLTIFPQFQMLPCEIRLLIWEASMTSQLVAIKPKPNGRRDTGSKKPKLFLPALFCVNIEARQCALRHYRWRFTLTLQAALTTNSHDPMLPVTPVPATSVRHARVVMSSHDTLGFIGRGFQTDDGYRWKIGIHSADETSPWERQTTAHESQVKLENVAILGPSLEADPRIIYDLNSTPSWDIDKILHNKSTMKLDTLQDPWYSPKDRTYSKQSLSIRHFRLTSDLQGWGESVLRRVPEPAMFLEADSPDIVSFKLRRKVKEGEPAQRMTPTALANLCWNAAAGGT